MPPTVSTSLSIKHGLPLSKIVSALSRRAVGSDTLTPLASIFALVIREPSSIHTRSLAALILRTPHLDETASPLGDSTLAKRQVFVLAIPTTYAGLNAGPSPGIVVGIMLGSIGGFLLIGWVFLLLVRVYSGRVIEKETIIRTHRRARSRSSHMSEAVRRNERRTTTIRVSQEEIRRGSHPVPTELTNEDEIIVEEEPDDIVEVIEEHSPERRESRRESRTKRSGFRTVDPAEFGGGDAPRRSIPRR